MKFTLPWLKEHVETGASLDAIVDTLAMLGIEVEEVDRRGHELHAFTVALITEVRPHPNADRLNLCVVETGSATLEVVCGAPNVRPGLKVVFAGIGTVIPESGQALKKSKIRGVESQGMICSARELKLGSEHDGILELPDDAAVGRPLTEVQPVEGPIVDVSITPNRGDCFSVLGIARELAAAGLGRLKPRSFEPPVTSAAASVAVRLEFTSETANACPLFVAQRVRGLKNGSSPRWLRERLTAIGLRPISTLVDITNLSTFDLGRPLHVFDAAKVTGDLVLRLAKEGETLEALDARTYRLDPSITVIADDTGPISLGGIMGGERTGVTEATTDVLLEIALFDPLRTAATGRRLGIESDARTRFERGLDPGMVMPGAALAVRLIQELCGGEAEPPVVAGALPPPRAPIALRPARVERLAGLRLESGEIGRLLEALGCRVEAAGEALSVVPPSWRSDLTMETDLVEEVVRLWGYDRIPPTPLKRAVAVPPPVLTLGQRRTALVRRTLADRGLAEAVTWSFLSGAVAERFGGAAVRLANPISADLDVMRPSVLANLVAATQRNLDRGLVSGGLFEIGPRFDDPEGRQALAAAGVRFGPARPRHWSGPARPVDVFDVKADALAALAAAGVETGKIGVDADAPRHFHPGRSGRMMLGPKTVLAAFGELHPAVLSSFGIEAPTVGFEVFLENLPPAKGRTAGKGRAAFKGSVFPPVERDFAFVLPEVVPAEHLLRAVRSVDKALIRRVGLFDVYQGKGLPEGTKSLAISVRLQAEDRTLTEAEIEPLVERIVTAAFKATGATLRT